MPTASLVNFRMVDRGPGAGYGIADLPEMLLSSDVKARYQKLLEGSMSDGAD